MFDVNSLSIEVTRRCNMTCAHCMRGDAQNLDMDLGYVDTLFSQTRSIACLNLTGGEPSLVPHIIDDVAELLRKHRVSLGNFYVATNALESSTEFIMSMIRLYRYCEDRDNCALAISTDSWHAQDEPYRLNWADSPLWALAFTENKYTPHEVFPLIKEGRAEEFGEREPFSNRLEYEGGYVDELYLNCSGNLVLGCDNSFATQDEPNRIICHVDDDIEAALEELMEKQYEESA